MFEMRRKDKQHSEQWALKLIEEAEYATVGTIVNGNQPYIFTISHALVDNYAYFHCAPEGLKVNAIAENQLVCMTCIGKTKVLPAKFSTEYQSAVAFGKASLVTDKEEIMLGFELICKKYSPGEDWQKYCSGSLDNVHLYKIELTDVTGKENVEH